MYKNIGWKIKVVATIFAAIGMIFGITIGIGLFYILNELSGETASSAAIGFLVAAILVLLSWIGSFVLFGYGELIEETSEIKNYLVIKNETISIKDKIAELEDWKNKGMITEIEFIEKIKSL